MRISRNHSRAICASLIIIAFFIPAYDNISALDFLHLAIYSVSNDAELTFVDLLIVSTPLLLVPLTAIIILYRSLQKKALHHLLLALPFFSLTFFLLLVSFDINKDLAGSGIVSLLKNMRTGFYLAALAALLLLLSPTQHESLDTGTYQR